MKRMAQSDAAAQAARGTRAFHDARRSAFPIPRCKAATQGPRSWKVD